MEPTRKNSSPDIGTFRRLIRLYKLALGAVALSAIVSQVLIQNFLDRQEGDAKVINISGRQRMLSQKLTKESLKLVSITDNVRRQEIIDTLKSTLTLWNSSHEKLQNIDRKSFLIKENSNQILQLFSRINPYFTSISNALGTTLAEIENNINISSDSVSSLIYPVLSSENEFLYWMDAITDQYEKEAARKVAKLRKLEYGLLIFTLLVLLAEFLFIFKPVAFDVKATMKKLLVAEDKAKKMAREADEMSNARERSVRELRALNYAMDQALLYARLTTDGRVIHLGAKFSNLFDLRTSYYDGRENPIHKWKRKDELFSKLIASKESEQRAIESVISENQRRGWQGEMKLTRIDQEIWLEMSLIPVFISKEKSELLLICMDITERKKAQFEIDRLNKETFEEKMNQQKVISGKIIENQENEQNRIAKDIHDGIGQMLTGLKFNLESINLDQPEKAASKIENLKELTTSIIKGVRTATFNLAPPELTDHGIVPALQKLTRELSRLTGKEIIFLNKSDFNLRLESLKEINIYRIVQEAINNAIKYAESSHIMVTLSHSEHLLSLVIDDNGKGFKVREISDANDGTTPGLGMSFMRERTQYIDGRIFINSIPGEGTRITLNIPI